MKFDKPKCPECGELAKGTLETVTGLAMLHFIDKEGNAEYDGETDIDWNNQMTIRVPTNEVILECPKGHAWLSGMQENQELKHGKA